jgi:hypothetical protein
MTEQHQARDLLATLRDALRKLALTLERTQAGVDAIATQAARIRESVEALSALGQPEDTAIEIEMLVDAAVDFLAAFGELESGIRDAQAEVDTLEAAMEDNENGREA